MLYSAWSSTYVTNLHRIFYLQKRAVRAITNSGCREHTAPLFAKLGILDIFQVSALQIAKFMFHYYKQLLPPMFLSLFSTSSQIHSYMCMTQEQPSLIDHITVVLILSSLQFSNRVLKFGILSQY